jgi:hypothetical protein
MQPTGGNIRTVLEQNAREPGYIPGLGNDAPGTDIGRGGETGPARLPGAAAEKGGGIKRDMTREPPGPSAATGSDNKTTSAAPGPGDLDMSGIAKLILGGGAALGGAYGVNKMLGSKTPEVSTTDVATGQPIGDTSPPVDGMPSAPPSPSSMQNAMLKATDNAPVIDTPNLVRTSPSLDMAVQPPVQPGPTMTNPAQVDPAILEQKFQSGQAQAPEVPFSPRPAGTARTPPTVADHFNLRDLGDAMRLFRR